MTKLSNVRATTPVDAYVGMRLRTLRRKYDYSQTELGDHVAVTFQQIQKYEKGANRISVSRLWQFCQVFNVRPEYFFDGLAGD